MGKIDRIKSKGAKYCMSRSDPERINLSKLPFRHRRHVRELFRNVAFLDLNSLTISSAKLCMIANQLDLRAAFFIFSCEYVLSEASGRL